MEDLFKFCGLLIISELYNAYDPEDRNEGGRVAIPTSFSIFYSYGSNLVIMSSLDSKWQGLKVGMPVFQLFYEMKLKTSMFKVLAF